MMSYISTFFGTQLFLFPNKDIYIIKIQFIIKNWIKMTVKEQPQVCDSAFQSGTFNVYARVRLF